MHHKPTHLSPKYAEQFQDSSIAKVYQYRAPYSTQTIQILLSFITEEPRTILDIGCGTGDLARHLVEHVQRIDAVDFSPAMLQQGQTLPNGNHPHLNWILGRIEEVNLHPPYTLITAGESLHWMDWEITFPLFQRLLTPHGYLAIVERSLISLPWADPLNKLIQHFSTNKDYQPYNLIEELQQRALFQPLGKLLTHPFPFTQTGEEYIHSIHSRNGFSRERMHADAAHTFDESVRKVIAPFLQDGHLTMLSVDEVVWGKP